MQPKITVLTLGVDDLERSLRFYRHGLRLPTQGIIGYFQDPDDHLWEVVCLPQPQ